MINPRFLFSAAVFSLGLATAQATDLNWVNSGTGNFSDLDNWSPSQAPVAGDNLTVSNGGTVELTGDAAFAKFTLSAGSFSMTGGTVAGTDEHNIGGSTSGSVLFEMSGGASWVNAGRINLGSSGNYATVNLTEGASISNSGTYFIVGAAGATLDMTLSQGANLTKGSANELIFADGANAIVNVEMATGSTITSQAYVKIGWSGGTANLTIGESGESQADASVFSTTTTGEGAGDIGIGVSGAANGTVTINGYSKMTVANELSLARDGSSKGTLILNDNANLTVEGVHGVMLGRNSSGEGRLEMNNSSTLNTKVLYVGNYGGQATGVMTMSDDSVATVSGTTYIATVSSTGTLTLQDNAKLTTNGMHVGTNNQAVYYYPGNTNANGKLFIKNEAEVTSNGTVIIGNRQNTGLVEMSDSSKFYVASGEVYVGNDYSGTHPNTNYATGTLKMSGDSYLEVQGGTSKFVVSRYSGNGTVELSGSAHVKTLGGDVVISENGNASLTISENATITVGSGGGFYIGSGRYTNSGTTTNENYTGYTYADAVGVVTMNGGTIDVGEGQVFLGYNGRGTGTLNFNAGVIKTTGFYKGTGSGTIYFNGGTVEVTSSGDLFSSGFSSGDLIVGSSGLVVDVESSADTALYAGLTGSGALTKAGAGAMRLYAKMENAGGIVVEEGTLTIIGTSGSETSDVLRDDATLSLAAGTSLVLDYDGTETLGFLLVQGHEVAAGVYDAYELLDYLEAEWGITDVDIWGAGYLNITAVPEPSTYALWGAGVMLLGAHVRRRRQK